MVSTIPSLKNIYNWFKGIVAAICSNCFTWPWQATHRRSLAQSHGDRSPPIGTSQRSGSCGPCRPFRRTSTDSWPRKPWRSWKPSKLEAQLRCTLPSGNQTCQLEIHSKWGGFNRKISPVVFWDPSFSQTCPVRSKTYCNKNIQNCNWFTPSKRVVFPCIFWKLYQRGNYS